MIRPGTKIVLTEGCIADDITIDGKSVTDVSDADLREVVRAIVEIADRRLLQDLIIHGVRYMGLYESQGHCPLCGDEIETYTIEL